MECFSMQPPGWMVPWAFPNGNMRSRLFGIRVLTHRNPAVFPQVSSLIITYP